MTGIVEIWQTLTGVGVQEARERVAVAADRLAGKLERYEGEARAREALSNLSDRMRGRMNGVAADH